MATAPRRPDDSRRGEENRERDRDLDEYRRKEVPRAEPARRPQQLNEYFIDGEGILREVLQMEICKYLGAEATCRPGEYNGRPGFRVKALRPFTPQMIDDLKTASREYVSENQIRRDRRYQGTPGLDGFESPRSNQRAEVPYEDSDTRRRKEDAMSTSEPSYPSSAYATSSGYEPGPGTGAGYTSSAMFPPGTGYMPVVTTTYPAPGLGASAGYQGMPNDQTRPTYGTGEYTYDSNRAYAPPGNYPGYAPPPGYRETGPRDQQMPPGYYTSGPPMQQGRGLPMDPTQHNYYGDPMAMQPPNPNPYAPASYRPTQYADPNRGGNPNLRPQPPRDSYNDYQGRRS